MFLHIVIEFMQSNKSKISGRFIQLRDHITIFFYMFEDI